MNFRKYFAVISLILSINIIFVFNVNAQHIPFLVNGYSDYIILLQKNPSPKCSKAVDELRIYLKKISGFQYLCSDRINPNAKYIIFEDGYCSDKSFDINKLNQDGFRLKNFKGNIYISAADGQGLINAVYYFLEKYVGCRYYSADEIFIPRLNDIKITNLTEDVQNPPFIFRTIHYYNAYQPEYAKLNRLHNSNADQISSAWGLWVHTMHKLVPPEKYFKEHPEYYALRSGVRIKDQLCLSNPAVLEIAKTTLAEFIKRKPKAKYWSVSQMDNRKYCECDKCNAIDEAEESPSGSIINFVNQLAIQFPNVIISTLAYQYSRKPPVNIKPEKNVNIMLCSAESDRNSSIAEDYNTGSFYDDLSNWSLVTKNIIIWDYVVNFAHSLLPFPNFHVLQPNIQLFANYSANMIFEQGYDGKSTEMNELRCYILAKLMWNPNENVENLINDFLRGYYGKAAPFIKNYIDLSTSELIKSGKILDLYEPPSTHVDGYLSSGNLNSYFQLFNKALSSVEGDSVKTHRVQMAMQSIRYAWIEVSRYDFYSDGWVLGKAEKGQGYTLKQEATELLETFYKTAKKYGPALLSETANPPDEYYNSVKNYFKNLLINHKAVGKQISFETPYSRRYSANGQNSLIDGIKGSIDNQRFWQGWWNDVIFATIDLDTIETIKQISISFLDDNPAWVMPPESVEISISDDNRRFKEVAYYQNIDARKKQKKQIVTFKIPLNDSFKARYIQINIKSIGKLPAWRGVNENAWTFIDEIVVN